MAVVSRNSQLRSRHSETLTFELTIRIITDVIDYNVEVLKNLYAISPREGKCQIQCCNSFVHNDIIECFYVRDHTHMKPLSILKYKFITKLNLTFPFLLKNEMCCVLNTIKRP